MKVIGKEMKSLCARRFTQQRVEQQKLGEGRRAGPNGLSFPCAYLFHVCMCVIKQKEREWEGQLTGPNSLSFPCAYVHTFLIRLCFRKLKKSNESHMGNNENQWKSTNVHETHVKINEAWPTHGRIAVWGCSVTCPGTLPFSIKC